MRLIKATSVILFGRFRFADTVNLYSGQGRMVYSNNGEHGNDAMKRLEIESGVLAEWDGQAENWNIVRRNRFTEVTGPAGISSAGKPGDPLWSIGWDILRLRTSSSAYDA